MDSELIEELAITCEVCGAPDLSDGAKRFMVAELATYPPEAVRLALRRCRGEITGRISLAAIVQRIDDGRPGPEEAWAMCPKNETETAVWTNEARGAYFSVYDMDDRIAARKAFLETYARLCREAKDRGEIVRWEVSPGTDPGQHERVLLDAVHKRRLTPGHARKIAPELPPMPGETPMLEAGPDAPTPAEVSKLVSGITGGMEVE
jgi:hypothetical protein